MLNDPDDVHKAAREARKRAIHDWLNTDPELRPGFIELSDELKALNERVQRWSRLAIGFRERV